MTEARLGSEWGQKLNPDGTCPVCGVNEAKIGNLFKHDLDKHDAHERTFRPALGTLTPYGYLALPKEESWRGLWNLVFEDPYAKLIDIRYSPLSYRNHCWSRKALTQVFWGKYEWVQDLGNVNYKERAKGIQLLEASAGIPRVVKLLQDGYNVTVLCACGTYETCHRKVVTELVQQALPELVIGV